MGLRHIKIASAQLEVPGNDPIVLRGLTLDDMEFLVREHSPALEAMYTDFIAGGDIKDQKLEVAQTRKSMVDIAHTLLTRAPGIACDLIACAANDDPAELDGDREVAARLPFPVQLEALEKLLDLTFVVTGGPKKVLETVIRLAQGTTGLLQDLQT